MTEKLSAGDAPAIYIVGETPDTLDVPRFDFSKVSYTDGRAMNDLVVHSQQKSKELQAAQKMGSFEDLYEELETLVKQQDDNRAKHGHDDKILAVRIRRLETRLENWQDVDLNAILAELNALMDQQESQILSGVVYVPRAWLTQDAPLADAIDWSDHANLRYLRGDKFQALARAKRDALNDSPN